MPKHDFHELIPRLVELKSHFTANGVTLATAESCTGGLLATAFTELSGSSEYYMGGVSAYANSVKTSLLGISGDLIEDHGAVSEEVAVAMAQSVKALIRASIGISTTGIAGPSGGTADKPVGTVWWALVGGGETWVECLKLSGSRSEIRMQTVSHIVHKVCELMRSE